MNNVKKLDKLKTAGIINIIDAILCIAIGVAFYLCLKLGVSGTKFENLDGLGFAVVLVLFLPLVMIAYSPIVVHAIYKIIYGILAVVNAKNVNIGKPLKFGKGMFTANIVLRVISIIMFAICAFLTYSIFDAALKPLLGILFTAFILILIGVQILAMVIDGGAKKQRKEYLLEINQ